MAEVQKLGRDISLAVTIERYDIVDSGGPHDNSAVSRGIDILKARVSLVKSGQHVEYTLRVVYEGGESWTMRKRFNEVSTLHDVLSKRLPALPDPPAKSVVRQFSPEYLEGRKNALTAYLRALCKRRDALNCVETQQFFELHRRVASFELPSGTDPVQAAEIHEASFGVASFDYDPVQGLLLMGATDSSWTSRIDTKITNIKLPWEPAAPNLPSSQMSLWRQSPVDLRFEMQFACRYTATISCVVLTAARDKGLCLCGLSDGTVGCHPLRGEAGVNSRGTTLPLLRHTAAVVALAVDEAEQWLISASKDSAIMVYDTRRQMIQCEVQTSSPTTVMVYNAIQKRLFNGLLNGRIVVWDTSILPIQQLAIIPDSATPDASRITAMDYDSVTSTLFSAAKDGFTLWAVKSSNVGCWGRRMGQITAMGSTPTAVAWASSSREILAGFSNGAVVVFDADKGEPSYAIQAHSDEVTAMLWLDAPRRLVTASKDKTMKVWDFPSLRRAPLEDQPAFAGIGSLGPTVSTAPHMGARSRPSADGSAAGPRVSGSGNDPLSGRTSGSGSFIASAANPLAAARAAGGAVTAAAAAAFGGSGSATGGSFSSANRGSVITSGAVASPSASAASLAAAGPRVAGSAPGAAVREDSDDDLAGWDR